MRNSACLGFLFAAVLAIGAVPAIALTIGAPTRVSFSSAGQNEPSVAIKGDRAVSFWNTGASEWAWSLDGGSTWANGAPLTRLDPQDRIRRLASVCVDDSAWFTAAVLYESAFGDQTVAIFRSRLEGAVPAWTGPVFAFAPFDGSALVDSTIQAPRVACDHATGFLYLVFTTDSRAYPGAYPASSSVRFLRSMDGGQTWSLPVEIGSDVSNGGRAVVGPDGEVYVAWMDHALHRILGRRSLDFGATFGAEFVIADMLDNLGARAVGAFGTTHGNPAYRCGDSYAPNFPAISVDLSAGPNRGSLYVAWSEYARGTLGPLNGNEIFATDPNERFVNAFPVEIGDVVNGDLVTELSPDRSDILTFEGAAGQTIWIDGDTDYPCIGWDLLSGPDTLSLMRITSTVIGYIGDPIHPALICTLPRTGRYYLRSNLGGGAYNVYNYQFRLRSYGVSPTSVARDHRDIVMVHSRDGGATWSQQVRVNDDPPMFDDSHPDVAVDQFGQVHVAWYDRRDDETNGVRTQTYWSRSADGGLTFEPSRRMTTQPSLWSTVFSGISGPGDHLALASDGITLLALWTQQGQPDWDIYSAQLLLDDLTAVEVSNFTGISANGAIGLRWYVSSIAEITGFRVHRAESESGAFVALSATPIQANRAGWYEFADPQAPTASLRYYKLEVLARDGATTWQGPIRVEPPASLSRLEWASVWPNPSAAMQSLRLAMPSGGIASVSVYDVGGKVVATLHEGSLPAGIHLLRWDGRDRAGRRAPDGIYWARARVGAATATATVIRVR